MKSWFLPASLARRFALGAAGLAAAALLLTSLASWWLINKQHRESIEELGAHERQFYAAAVGSQLRALAVRMSEVASSTILATGLVDSVGRETYLVPFLAGIRHINGVPLQVIFTDFEGKEIANNGIANFSEVELAWLRGSLALGRPSSVILPSADGFALVAMEPLVYARTKSPEGGLLYKVSLSDVHAGEGMQLEWGGVDEEFAPNVNDTARVPVPAVFEHLDFRVRGPSPTALAALPMAPEYVAVFVVALTLFAGVVVAGTALAKVLTRDVQRLEAFSRKVISSGLSAERAPMAGSAEVTSLAASVNRMLDRLQEQQSALVGEREKLTDLAGALQAADQRKDEFLAMLAHELRNPLAPIANSLEIMKRANADAELTAKARATAERQVRHLVRLVDDLLDVSRITRGKLELRRERVDLLSVVDQAVESCRTQIDTACHSLRISRPHRPIFVDADPVRLVQVLSNLINNAARYTEPGGRITIEIDPTDSHVNIRVKDTGIGIAPEMAEHVFEMFARADQSHSHGGLGIGLTLAKRLAELHHGTLTVRSEGLGHGSEFDLRLPLSQSQGLAPSTAAAVTPGAAPRRILVVDDNRDAAASLAALLQVTGNETRIAYDGEEAVAAAAEYKPDVIMLDIGLPKMDGYDACRAIRRAPDGGKILIVALTGWGQAQDRKRSREAGFDVHLVKPVDYEKLVQVLAEPYTASAAS